MNISLVAVGFNRYDSLSRLLNSLSKAEYNGYQVTLIISLDYSPKQDEILASLSSFKWTFGDLKIIAHSENLGLRAHILKCGDLSQDYDAVVVFEDDLIASPVFFKYVLDAISFYNDDDRISGFSLYSPRMNEMVELPFEPLLSGYDTYMLQSAQSWGQCWTKRGWQGFRKWYDDNNAKLLLDDDMPSKIYSWPKTSWKKYYMKYLVETNKYFVYPYSSFSTNASEIGQHNKSLNSDYQVQLQNKFRKMSFAPFDDAVIYDVFFENSNLTYQGVSDQESKKVCCDLYGSKCTNFNMPYFLSTNKLPFEIVETFSLSMRPHEANFFSNVPGDDIYLYKTQTPIAIGKSSYKIRNIRKKISSFHLTTPWSFNLSHGIYGMKDFLLSLIFTKR